MFIRLQCMKCLVTTCLAGIFSLSAFAGENDPSKKPAPKQDSSRQESGLEQKGFRDLMGNLMTVNTTDQAPGINPVVMPFVKDYLAKHEKQLMALKGWAMPHFQLMDGILSWYGLPKELKYLAVIESNLKTTAYSWAGAVGPWQFMPETGRRMGLRISGRIDERMDYIKSTHAAARYLKELYRQLGDWLLVIAAYNGGPGRVTSAIKRSGSSNFWNLQYFLPRESRDHVKKFISTHYILEGGGGQTTSTKQEWASHKEKIVQNALEQQSRLDPELMANTETTEVQGRYNSVVVANALMMDINLFNTLNPGFDTMAPGEKGYTLRLPKDKIEQFKANRFQILYQSLMTTMRNAGTTLQQATVPKK